MPQSICAKVVVIRHCGSPCGILSASFFALLVSSVAMKTSLAAFSLWREDDTEFTTCNGGFHLNQLLVGVSGIKSGCANVTANMP